MVDTKNTASSEKLENIDYKDAYFLRRFLNSQGKIYPPKKYGLSTKQQRELTQAIKRARFMALIPYVIK
ncbi:MAG: 30S ribosomal protein S18 [Candidatus Moranbacteria bacterium]|nr:30S ribosomal protein S18 [Candidatus Moranbacteria bacterium]